MKYGTVTRLLAAAYVVIVQLTGCSPDTEELEKFPQAIPIRICLLYTSPSPRDTR